MSNRMYQDKSKRAKELKESAVILICFGGLGMLLVVLYWNDMITLPISHSSKYLIETVLLLLFILLFVMGLKSSRDYEKMIIEAKRDKSIGKEIFEWCRQSITRSLLEEQLQLEDEENLVENTIASQEELYFLRTEVMKALIESRYMNVKEDFLEHIVELYYTELYPE